MSDKTVDKSLSGSLEGGTVSAVRFAELREGIDAAASTSTTATIGIGDTFDGTVSRFDPSDWVRVSLTAGETYNFALYGIGGVGGLKDPLLRLRTDLGTIIAENDDVEPDNLFSHIEYTATVSGTYYLDASGFGSNLGNYQLRTATDFFSVDEVVNQLTYMGWGRAPAPLRLNKSVGQIISYNLGLLGSDERQLAQWALETWQALTGLRFVETLSQANISFKNNDPTRRAEEYYAFAGLEDINTQTGLYSRATITISENWVERYGTGFGSYSFYSYMHEIGHALGLAHAGFYNETAQYPRDANYLNDSYQMSLMSYFSPAQNTTVDATDFLPITPMIADSAAIRETYGAPTALFNGNTTWGANSNVGGMLGVAFSVMFDGAERPSTVADQVFGFNIVDTSGVDTLDFSKYSGAQKITLKAGGISDVYGNKGTVTVGIGTLLENAIGGTGNDEIEGNTANNTLNGGEGNDIITGGGGNDLAILGQGNDRAVLLSGDDNVWSGEGNDNVLLGDGKNTAYGGTGNDNITSGNGDDKIGGGSGNDIITGGAGNDILWGGADNDQILGEAGNDVIWAGDGSDSVSGGDGSDVIGGGKGNDDLTGGSGADRFVFFRESGNDQIQDFSTQEEDRLYLGDWLWQESGALSAQQVVSQFAATIDQGVLFTFLFGRTSFLLNGLSSTEGLSDNVVIFGNDDISSLTTIV